MEAYNLDITEKEIKRLLKTGSVRLSDIAIIGCDDCGNDSKFEIYLNIDREETPSTQG